MRKRAKNSAISVHAIAGTHVVLLGLNATPKGAKDLLGFNIFKKTGASGFKALKGGDRDFEGVKSNDTVIQSFIWSDYTVVPKKKYTYKVVPLYGDPKIPKAGNSVSVTINTEDPDLKQQAVFFNRGVAGSQAYSRLFGKHRKWYKDSPQEEDPDKMRFSDFIKPEDIPDRKAYKWLSRGLEEAMLDFIGQATGPDYSIRAALYELTHEPAIQAFVDALERGADVKIAHHAKRKGSYKLKSNKDAVTTTTYTSDQKSATVKSREVVKISDPDEVCHAANEAVAKVGVSDPKYLMAFKQMLIPRTITQISHNKFIVLLKKGKPIQVWTGSTNVTPGGIYGQSNLGHIVRDPKVAATYLAYWEKLATDPVKTTKKNKPDEVGMRNFTAALQPDLKGPPPKNSITPIFSPRLTDDMLQWYADRLDAANGFVCFTAAFSVANEIYEKVIRKKKVGDNPYLRYLLLEGNRGLIAPKIPAMEKCPQNKLAWGETLRQRKGVEEELIETLTGLNENVNYLHTKYMLLDPLSDDPIVISGSANFSTNSTVANDENMLVIRGNTRVADIFLGEFMRLFNHFHSRNELNRLSDAKEKESRYLVPDDSWTKPYYTKGTQDYSERLLFS